MKFSSKVLLYFRVEPFMWFVLFGICLRTVTFSQLIQDKLCRNVHNRTDTFCRRLSDMEVDDPDIEVKNDVLAAFSHFNMYYTALGFIPSIVATVFLCAWSDNYRPGRKILLLVSSLGITLETVIQAYMAYDFALDYRYSILGAVPQALGGGISTGFIAVYSYIPATTPNSLRTIRFMAVEVLVWFASPSSMVLGGYLLNLNTDRPLGGNGQLLNYQLVYITSGVFTIIAFLWVVFLVDEKRDKAVLDKLCKINIDNPMERLKNNRKTTFRPLESIVEEKPNKNPIKLLFDCDNFREIVRTATKIRPNRGRLQLWLIIIWFLLVGLSYRAPLTVMFPFAQEAYHWDSKKFRLFNSISMVLNSIGILFGTLFFTKMLNIDENPLAIFGLTAFFVSSVIKATLVTPLGFWLSTLIGCLGGLATIGVRTYLSKIVEHGELGKVFCLLSAIDGSLPFVANFFFTIIFTQTIDTFVGAVFDVSAALLLIPLVTLIYIDVFCGKTSDRVDNNPNVGSKTRAKESVDRNGEQLTYRTIVGVKSIKQKTTEL